MTYQDNLHIDIADRLAAVAAAITEAEAAGRFLDVESLRLAQRVLRGLLEERASGQD
jgi:hypothetical protein